MSEQPDRPIVSRLLDAAVYAPIGLLTEPRQVVADLASQGRKQAAFSRSLGQAVLKRVAASTRPSASVPVAEVPKPQAARPEPTETEQDAPADSATADAIAGYESMTAREIIALLADASEGQVAWILETERGAKQRVTVLRAATARQ